MAGVSSAARSNAALAASWPPRFCARSATRSSSAATDSSTSTAAAARCQARRSASRAPDITPASARWASRRAALAYLYTPLAANPVFGVMVRVMVVPVLVGTGLAMWLWPRLRRRLSWPNARPAARATAGAPAGVPR
jgi:hypothetical protein